MTETDQTTGVEPPTIRLDRTDLYRVYESIWRNMDRENNLINQRVGWSIFFSAGIIAAAALCSNTMIELAKANLGLHWLLLGFAVLFVLSMLGAFFSFRVIQGVNAALDQLEYLRRKYERDEAKFKAMGLPRPFGERKEHDRGRHASLIFPQTVMLIWSAGAMCCLLALGICIAQQLPAITQPAPVTSQSKAGTHK